MHNSAFTLIELQLPYLGFVFTFVDMVLCLSLYNLMQWTKEMEKKRINDRLKMRICVHDNFQRKLQNAKGSQFRIPVWIKSCVRFGGRNERWKLLCKSHEQRATTESEFETDVRMQMWMWR